MYNIASFHDDTIHCQQAELYAVHVVHLTNPTLNLALWSSWDFWWDDSLHLPPSSPLGAQVVAARTAVIDSAVVPTEQCALVIAFIFISADMHPECTPN